MKNDIQDLIIIGGGIMGLMTAYFASGYVKKITILEKRTSSNKNKDASSFSFTRSFHADYLDPLYVTLAYESLELWKELEKKYSKKLFIECGSLNIAKKTITPDISKSYAAKSYQNRIGLQFDTENLLRADIKKRLPQFDADFGSLDSKGGLLYLPAVTELLLQVLKEKGVLLREHVEVTSIQEKNKGVSILTKNREFTTKKLVVTANRWVNDVLRLVKKNKLQFPINPEKPQESKYFYPPKEIFAQFLPEKLPVFAYLDVGIYGHPIFDKKRGAMKISYYNPPDLKQKKTNINSVKDFVNECMPILKNVPFEDVKDADQCAYDFLEDDTFIIGKLPKFRNIVVGAGWRGTGYKFAPLVGKILSQLTLQNATIYDVSRFTPERFTK